MSFGSEENGFWGSIRSWIAANKVAAVVIAGVLVIGGGTAVAFGAGNAPEPEKEPVAPVVENLVEPVDFMDCYLPNLLRGDRMTEPLKERMWEKAVAESVQPEVVDQWQELYDEGVRHAKDGDYDSAVSCFQEAITVHPDRAAAYLELAKAYVAMEKYDLAKETLEDGLKKASGGEDLSALLKDVEKKIKEEGEKEVIEVPEVVVAEVNDVEDPESESGESEKGTSTEINMEEIIEEEKNHQDTPGYESVSRSYGIDVSKYQGNVDWAAVAESGVEFAIIRIGYRGSTSGEIYMDPYFTKNIKGALANGVKVGIYFFSTAVDEEEAKVEAAWVCKQIASYQITYPVVYDCEGYNNSSYRTYGIGRTQRSKNAAAFLNYVKGAGYTPMMYASKYAYNNEWDLGIITGCKYWLAHYTKGGLSTESDYKGSYQMWQYSSKGSVSGIKGYVDMNVAYFSYSNTPDPTIGTVTYQVKDEAGNPVAGVEVSLTGENSRTTVKAVTDGDGKAAFSKVVARDTYSVKVSSCPAGYETSSESQTSVELMKEADTYEGSLTVRRIVCSSITYTVKDEAGKPVAGVTVKLAGTSAHGNSQVSLTASTGADGRAVFQNVLLGSYTVSVSGTPTGYAVPAEPVTDALTVASSTAISGNKVLQVVKASETQPETPTPSVPETTPPSTETPSAGTTEPSTETPSTEIPGSTEVPSTEPTESTESTEPTEPTVGTSASSTEAPAQSTEAQDTSTSPAESSASETQTPAPASLESPAPEQPSDTAEGGEPDAG